MTKAEMVYAILKPTTRAQKDYADKIAKGNTKATIEAIYNRTMKGGK